MYLVFKIKKLENKEYFDNYYSFLLFLINYLIKLYIYI